MLSLFVFSCSNTKEDGNVKIEDILRENTGQNGRACVRISDIDSYGFDGRTFTINARRKYYLGTTLMRCHNADMAARAVFDGPAGDFCGGGSSRIVVRNARCSVGTLFEFENREAAFAAKDAALEALAQAGEADAKEAAEKD